MYCNTCCKIANSRIMPERGCRLSPGPPSVYTQALLNCIEILRIFLFLRACICYASAPRRRDSISLSLPAVHMYRTSGTLRGRMALCTSNLHICICPGEAPPTFCCRIPASLLPRSHTQSSSPSVLLSVDVIALLQLGHFRSPPPVPHQPSDTPLFP